MTSEWLTRLGLLLDLLGAAGLGISTTIIHKVLATYDAAGTFEQKRWMKSTERVGWALLASGFVLQLWGSF